LEEYLIMSQSVLVRVRLQIIQGRNMASKDSNGLSDPFAVVSFASAVVYKTKIMPCTLNPVWPDEYAMLWCARVDPSSHIVVEVWDHDVLGPPEFMGACEVDLWQAAQGACNYMSVPDVKWYPLHDRGIASEEVTGDIQLGLQVCTVKVRKEGWLLKRGAAGRTKRRYCCIFDAPQKQFVYFVDDNRAGKRDHIKLDESEAAAAATVSKVKGPIWTLSAPKSSELSFKCETDAEALAWHNTISEYISAAATYQESLPPSQGGVQNKRFFSSSKGKKVEGGRKFYKVSIAELAKRGDMGPTGAEVPKFVMVLINRIRETGMTENGVFRVSGTKGKINDAVARLEKNGNADEFLLPDESIHVVTGLLKLFLRELPEPVCTFDLYKPILDAMLLKDEGKATETLRTLVREKMPASHRVILDAVFCLLSDLLQYRDKTLMTASNLGIVFGPTILWGKDQDALSMLQDSNAVTAVAEYLTNYYREIFTDYDAEAPVEDEQAPIPPPSCPPPSYLQPIPPPQSAKPLPPMPRKPLPTPSKPLPQPVRPQGPPPPRAVPGASDSKPMPRRPPPPRPPVAPDQSKRRAMLLNRVESQKHIAQINHAAIFAQVDPNSPGALSKQAERLFRAYDLDNSQALDIDEFIAFFIDLIQYTHVQNFSRNDVMTLMEKVSEGDMLITLEQFMVWWSEFATSQA